LAKEVVVKRSCQAELVPLGKVIKPHSFRGEIKFKPYYDPGPWFGCETLYREQGSEWQPMVVESWRGTPARPLLRLSGVADETAAEALRGTVLYVDASIAGIDDLTDRLPGWQVFDDEDNPVGKIKEVLATPGHDVLIVTTVAGEKMFPLVDEWVRIEREAGRVVLLRPVGDGQ